MNLRLKYIFQSLFFMICSLNINGFGQSLEFSATVDQNNISSDDYIRYTIQANQNISVEKTGKRAWRTVGPGLLTRLYHQKRLVKFGVR